MNFHLAVSIEKPVQHLALSDWIARVDRIRNVGDARRADSAYTRNTSRMLCNECRIEGNWANYDSNNALKNRIAEVELWRDLIAKSFVRLELEIETLKQEKAATEAELDAQVRPLELISKVFALRDARLIPETTHDYPDIEIKNEMYILENNNRLLMERCQKAWEKLVRLEDVRFRLISELKNKDEAEDTDSALLALDDKSNKISFKFCPLRNPRDCCSYEHWLDNAKNMKQLVENELAATSVIRDALFVCRAKSRTMLEVQRKRTAYSFRKRIFLTKQAGNELEYQQLKTREEIQKLACDIESLEDAVRSKTNVMKLAETRLETRAMRCIPELCLDDPHHVLCREVEKLREIVICLQNKIDDAKANYNLLSDYIVKIDDDLERKKHSLAIDTEALQLHASLNAVLKDRNPSEQTDLNIEQASFKIENRD